MAEQKTTRLSVAAKGVAHATSIVMNVISCLLAVSGVVFLIWLIWYLSGTPLFRGA